MNYLTLKSMLEEKDRFEAFERSMNLPKGSIGNRYKKSLYLKIGDIQKVNEIYDKLIVICEKVPFTFSMVHYVYEQLEDFNAVEQVLHHCRKINESPFVVVDAIHNLNLRKQ